MSSNAVKRINKLVLDKFRGATTKTVLEFDDKKPIVLIFGENGRGKSTIIDAIDFVCNKSPGSIKARSSTDHKKHLSAIGHGAKDFSVTLQCGEKEWMGRHNGKEILVDGEEEAPPAFILRRNKLLRLVEAKPGDRYDELRRFIDVDNVEKSEQVLRDAINGSKSQLDRFATLQTEAEETLDRIWRAEGTTGDSATEWAKEKIRADVSDLQKQINQIEDVLDFHQKFQIQFQDYQKANNNYKTAQSELAEIQKEVRSASDSSSGDNIQLIDLLAKVERYLAKTTEQNNCPVCLSEYDSQKLKNEINQRLNALNSFEDLRKRLESKNSAVKRTEIILSNAERQLSEIGIKYLKLLNSSEIPNLSPGLFNLPKYDGLFKTESIDDSLLEKFQVETAALYEKLDNRQRNLQNDLSLYNTIKQFYEKLSKIKQDAEEEDQTLQGLRKIFDVIHGERIRYTQNILDAVKDECSRLYEAIHPDEPYKLTRLRLDEKTKGSLHQEAHFDGHDDVPPQAYFSESHLDTLGFCFWLAVAKYSSGGNAIVVLDDAFTSVDIDHVSRIMDLLTDLSAEFNQIIITTHQRRWHDGYRYGTKSQGKTQVYELGYWDKKNGVRVFPSKMEHDKLKEMLDAPVLDRQSVCSKAGVLLEKIFDELSKYYQCSIPRNARNEYTLDTLCGSTKNLFKKLMIERTKRNADGSPITSLESEQIKLQDLHDKISPFVAARNQVGAHFNLGAEEYSEADVRRFVRYTIELAENLLCPDCHAMALKLNKEHGHHQCSCKNLKMFPNKL